MGTGIGAAVKAWATGQLWVCEGGLEREWGISWIGVESAEE